MRILVTGCDGQLGKALARIDRDNEMIFLSRNECDITRANHVAMHIEDEAPHIVINAAAYTAVDLAETEKAQAHDVNVLGVENMAKVCNDLDIPLIHVSTDYVFDGETSDGYIEESATNPLNTYAVSKLKGEEVCQSYCPKSVIIRTSGVFSSDGTNFVKSILNAAKTNETLDVVEDQVTCPTHADSVAQAAYKIAQKIIDDADFVGWGIYHFASQPAVSWHAFATAIVDEARQFSDLKTQTLNPISSKQSKRPAARPKYSVLKCDKIQNVFGIKQPDWHSGLHAVLQELLR